MTETVSSLHTEDAPVFPSDRTCPYQLPDQYSRLRDAEDSLRRVTLYDGSSAWVVTKYQAARALLADPRLSSDRTHPGFPATSPRNQMFTKGYRKQFVMLDPPEHGPKRRMVVGEFRVQHVKDMRPEIEQIVHGFIDDMLAAGPPGDLVSQFSLAVPSMVICRLLGVPYEDHQFFQDASRRLVQAATAAEGIAARADLDIYLDGLITTMQAAPRPGILSSLIADQLAHGEIDREELVGTAVMLLVGGHETTASMTSLSVITLLEHAEQHAVLRADPDLIPGAVEELLRYASIADFSGRVAKDDIEIDGQVIKAGDGVIVANSIANRDSSVFDEPDTFDVHRPGRRHIAFGYGAHQCLGQNLARLELDIMLTALFDRIPTLRLAVPVEQLALRPGTAIQGVNELPVTW